MRLRYQRRLQTLAMLGLVLLGPILALATFLVLGPFDSGTSVGPLRLVLLADLVYVLLLAGLVTSTIARMVAARRARSAGSQLHLRLTGVFVVIALIPTITVAVFAAITINFGLEGWFSDRVRNVVGASLAAAEAYETEQRRDLSTDAEALAAYLARARTESFFVSDGEMRQQLARGQAQIQRGLREAYVIDGSGEIRARGERSYLFDYEEPGAPHIEAANTGETVIVEDWALNEFRALIAIPGFADRYLWVSRDVDGALLALLDDTKQSALLYRQLESERGRLLFEFGLLYLGFAVILILAATWLGLWFAERLSRPVGRLAAAAQRVGAGDFDVRVAEGHSDDEITMLGRIFNQMTRQLKAQRSALMSNTAQIEGRRRLFDSVLGSVTAGVMGLDPDGRVTLINRSAAQLLRLGVGEAENELLALLVPEFEPLLYRLAHGSSEIAQEELRVTRRGQQETLLVRMARRRAEDGRLEGFVVAFDDVTDLVMAQRMAAWADVARRIAHEIKNPLTPIQLSAERIRRKFRAAAGDDAEALEQMCGVIVRQTEDLRRIVDEFSKFARMPEPDRRKADLVQLVRDAVTLQRAAEDKVRIVTSLPDNALYAEVDQTMIGQALTNLIKNAGEAMDARAVATGDTEWQPEIRIALEEQGAEILIAIEDNGVGLPEDVGRLLEPYVTTREKGTGLGLPIVRKIIEEHGGSLRLADATPFAEDGHAGARAEIRLPNNEKAAAPTAIAI